VSTTLLVHDLAEGFRLPCAERPPSEITRSELVAFRRDQDVATHEEIAPGIAEVAATRQHTHELESRIRNADFSGFPVAQRARGDTQHLGAFLMRPAELLPSRKELASDVLALEKRAA